MEYSERLKKFEEHVRIEHKRSPLSAYFKEVIYGGVDGIITTFSVVAGFSGAAFSNETTTQLSFVVVLLFGLANLFADSISMGLGNFLSVRSDQSLYRSIRAKEKREFDENTEMEAEETQVILMQRGFSEADARTLTTIYRKNESYWIDFMMNNELNMPDPTGEKPFFTALATSLAFIFFGSIPLLPFIIFGSFDPQTVFEFSAGGTLVALVVLGILKWKVTGAHHPLRAIGEVVLIGSLASASAFFVGTLFTF